VTGLKNSGKTTACTALIGQLTDRGCAVAAIKSSHVRKLTLDYSAGDSFALADSGARFVLVQGPEESLILEKGGRSYSDMLDRVPEGVDFIISEGGEPRAARAVIVCLRDPSDWEETLKVRQIPEERILAVAGSFLLNAGGMESFEGFPVCDATRPADCSFLVQRIIEAAACD
jgi:molybdopterin-guanine dinucleotide biosynthesis protein MobB